MKINFLLHEINAYARSGFSRHLDQRRMLYLDLYSGNPQLAVNNNYFRVEPPPHLQQLWKGNVFGDTSTYNIGLWDANSGFIASRRITDYTNETGWFINKALQLVIPCRPVRAVCIKIFTWLTDHRPALQLNYDDNQINFGKNDS